MSVAAVDEFNELMRNKERRTAHPYDHDSDSDRRSFLNLSDDEGHAPHIVLDDDYSRPSMSLARTKIPHRRYEANTGPKGVISDAQNFRDSRRLHRQSARSASLSIPTLQNGSRTPSANGSGREKTPSDEDDLDEDDEDVDPDFLHSWRQRRLRELRHGAVPRIHSRERSIQRTAWGSIATVDEIGFLDALEKSPVDTVVVVYIYDNCSHVSESVEDCLRPLAQKHRDVRFVKLHFQAAEMEPAGVPALLAYRGGEKFAGLVPVIQELPDDAELSPVTLESVLKRHQILR